MGQDGVAAFDRNRWPASPGIPTYGVLLQELEVRTAEFFALYHKAVSPPGVLDNIGFYNADRLHSSNVYLIPMDYEKVQLRKFAA